MIPAGVEVKVVSRFCADCRYLLKAKGETFREPHGQRIPMESQREGLGMGLVQVRVSTITVFIVKYLT